MNAFSQYLPSDRTILSKEDFFDQMCLKFGGRVAESLIFNHTSTNSEQDLKNITRLAYEQVKACGMSEKIGNMAFSWSEELGRKPYSKKLHATIDMEVNQLVAQAHKKATETVNANLDRLHLLANELLKKEILNYEDIVKLIGPPLNQSRYNLAKASSKTTTTIN